MDFTSNSTKSTRELTPEELENMGFGPEPALDGEEPDDSQEA